MREGAARQCGKHPNQSDELNEPASHSGSPDPSMVTRQLARFPENCRGQEPLSDDETAVSPLPLFRNCQSFTIFARYSPPTLKEQAPQSHEPISH
jgi:hypothetical protein